MLAKRAAKPLDAVRFPCATALLNLWSRSWSSAAKRYAAHALARAYARGLDVMEIGREATLHDGPALRAFEASLAAPWSARLEDSAKR